MYRLFDYLLEAVRSPREKLSRGQQFVRRSVELAVHCYRQLQRQRAEGMAAELTYRTIFALIPVVVLGLVMFRIVGGLEDVQQKVENELFSFFGVPEIPVEYASPLDTSTVDTSPADTLLEVDESPTSSGSASTELSTELADSVETADSGETADRETGAESEAATRRVAQASIRKTLHDLASKVSSVDFASVGAFGLLLFIYAAVALASSAEHLFNRIYDAPSQRPLHLRLAIHWSIITLGSGLLAMSLYTSGQVVEWVGAIGGGPTIQGLLSHLFSIVASWVLLFLLYALMPNTNVSARAAAIGAVVGSLLWEAAKFGFQIYVAKAVPYSIYGSIGLLPLFLLWIYVTWLIVLFGLILTYTLQSLRGRLPQHFSREDASLPTGDPDWMLPIMCEVSHEFLAGNPITPQDLADQLGLSSRVVHEMTQKLIDAEMLLRVTTGAGEQNAVSLARPAEKIRLSEILALAHDTGPDSDHPAWKTLADLKQAERDAAESKTLADVQGWKSEG